MSSLPEFTRRAALACIASSVVTAVPRPIPAGVMSGFGSRTREKLATVISGTGYRGNIDAPTVNELLRLENTGIAELMLKLLPLARLGSYAPLSNYHVGAVIQSASQSLYLGANIEVPGQALGFAVHAEQAAIANLYMHGAGGITALAVTAAPCGHCRQFLTEFVPDGNLRVLFVDQTSTTLAALLPQAFGPKDLGRTQGALPIGEIRLALHSPSPDPVVRAALAAARKAYSPYTQAPSGVAVMTSSGRTFSGSYIENVAFNPSLSPLQTALAGMLAAGEGASSIVRAVLVEVEDAHISQKAAAQATLGSLAPAARLESITARRQP